jgi:hypothetical protein
VAQLRHAALQISLADVAEEVKRKERLRHIVPPQPARLLYVDHLEETGLD